VNADLLNLAFRKLEYVDTQQPLRRLDKAWVAFKDSYAGLSESDVLEPGVTKAWSVRDIIAHVTTRDEEALKHLPAILEGRRPPHRRAPASRLPAPRRDNARVSAIGNEVHRRPL
jgi:hypothetical protein